MTRVYRASEILLNNQPFPIQGMVRPRLASTYPNKIVIGDFTKDDEQIGSTWIISDQRGGIGIEEMDEEIHADRSCFSSCNARFAGHIILPPLATEITPPWGSPSAVINADMELTTGWTQGARSSEQKHGGTYSWKLTIADAFQNLTGWVAGATYTLAGWCYATGGACARIGLDDGVSITWSSYVSGDNVWEQKTVTKTLSLTATRLRIYMDYNTYASYYDDFSNITRTGSYGYVTSIANFNSKLYFGSSGGSVAKLNAAGDGLTEIVVLANEVKDLTSSLGVLFVLLGAGDGDSRLAEDLTDTATTANVDDGTQFAVNDYIRINNEVMKVTDIATNALTVTRAQWGTTATTHSTNARVLEARKSYYMDVDETFTLCNAVNAKLGVDWDDKFFFLDKLNQIAYITSLAGNSTGSGRLKNLADDATKRLLVYRDANGNPIIYAGTVTGLWAHDYTNSKWLQTELTLPDHPTCGKGFDVWRDSAYISAGLSVFRYIAANTAVVQAIGLDLDDGLPAKYRGEITHFTRGYTEFYALIDASLVSGTGYSIALTYNGTGWQSIWVDPTADQAMHCGIVSSVYDYRYYWGVGSKVYYIPLQRNIQNPLKISGYTYAASSIHVTGIFDAATAWDKRAIRVKCLCDGMVAGNEEIIVKYRINANCFTDIDANWTTLGTLSADGETSISLGTGAGLLFKQIQFRFDFARGATNTNTPDLQRMTLVYQKTMPAAWGWDVVLDLTKSYRGRTPEQMWQDLKALVGGVLIPFVFTHEDGSAETNYVEIRDLTGLATTGARKLGTYSLQLIAP